MRRVRTVGVCAPGCDRGGRGRRHKPAFTLIELLVVISIIALLVSMLMPTLALAMKLARRARCATQLGNMGRELAMYATAHGVYPYVPLNGGGWGVAVGTGRDVAPSDSEPQDRNPTSCLYLLVRGSFSPAAVFVCPSSGEKGTSENRDGWDFVDGGAVSYSLMNPYGPVPRFRADTPSNVPVMADTSPYFAPATGLRNDVEVVDWASADEQDARRGNSRNHQGEGQNVALFGGSTHWQSRADVGHGHDNIYSRAGDDDEVDPHGSIPPAAPDGADEDQGPAGEEDSYLVP